MKKITLLFMLLLVGFQMNAQSVVINEIITSNAAVITDDDGSYEDWVELYNTSANPINLAGYGLTDLASNPYLWVFPEYWMEPGEHLLIWCSDKNRTDINFPLHTNFKISSGGESITLTDNNGVTVDSYPAVIIPQNYTYGRQTDGSPTLVIFPEPTPGESNTTQGFSEVLTAPTLSVAGGFYTAGFPLTISHTDPAVTIVYTTDGSDPELSNLAGTTYNYKNQYVELVGQTSGAMLQNQYQTNTYTTPLNIVDRTSQANDVSAMSSTFQNVPNYIPDYNVAKGTVVRARAFKTNAMPSPIVTKTYFVSPQGSAMFSLPVVSLSVTESKFFDYEDGIYVAGKDFDDWRAANPTEDADVNNINEENANANYLRSGDATEQSGNINYFVNGNEVLNQNLGIRINGGNSRGIASKSLRLYARSEFGDDTFSYPFFASETYNSYKRLVLRNSGQDFYSTMFRDGIGHTLINGMNTETRAYQPSIVFLNGEYWGILNIRERYDRHFFERKYGIVEGQLDYLKDDLTPDEGDTVHYEAMATYLENNSLVNQASYDYIATQLDPENFRDYFIANIYEQNTDWPGWNTVFWRKRTAAYEPAAPFGQDGRWRTAINDLDDGTGNYPEGSNHNTLAFATATGIFDYPNPEWSTLILRKLLENNEFKLNFINRFADALNTYFHTTRVLDKINAFKTTLEPEMGEHYDRWDNFFDLDSWDEYSIQQMRDFATERPDNQRNHIRTKFGISGDINATLNVSDATHGFVKINTIEINSTTPGVAENPYPWTGIYFQNIPVTLKAVALPGFVFSHWSGDSNSTEAEITITTTSNFSVTANFVPDAPSEVEVPIYFWIFDSTVTNDTPLTALNSSFEVPAEGVLQYESCLIGYPFDAASPNWRKASMERRNSPTDINYIPEANSNIPFATSNMRGLQIKQPFQNGTNENAMIFNVSTVNYKDIKFAFAAKNELAADAITVEYSTASGSPSWISSGSYPLTAAYQLFNVDLSAVAEAENNVDFKVRLRFTGTNMTEDLGNRVTFNNVSVKGVSLNLGVNENTKLNFKVFPNPVADILNIVHQYDSVDYKLFAIDGKLIQSGSLVNPEINVNGLQPGIYMVQFTTDGKSEVKKFIKK
ncbi:MAG TPA: CotH kinase family protein [Flavobacterium sp.]|nr:CotH kinase family protein [Flavobacterium sp.]